MLQVFPFKGEEFGDVYRQARAFLYALSLSGISVSLPDGYRANTKFYPDYQTTMTVIEIFPDIVTAEQVETVEAIYADISANRLHNEAPAPADEVLKLGKGHRLELSLDTDGWLLVDCHEDQRQVVFRDVQSPDVLESIRHHLKRDPGDDFDPFLDSEDLP